MTRVIGWSLLISGFIALIIYPEGLTILDGILFCGWFIAGAILAK